MKLAVWKRDGGRCTFTTETGHRCPARDLLQYDHIDPVARGGEATVENLRLRCRTHNQLDAEQAFGKEFIAEKRETARRERAATRQQAANAKLLASPDRDADPDPERDVVPRLRQLRCRPEHIRLAASHCESLPEGTSLDDRVREAVRFVGRLRFPGRSRHPHPRRPVDRARSAGHHASMSGASQPPEIRLVATTVHGRVLVDPPARPSRRWFVGFHGYGHNARIFLDLMRRVPGSDGWLTISIQGLHPFYHPRTQEVLANWMTREDREHAIADNVRYVDTALADAASAYGEPESIVFAGFSQGVAMAFRAALPGGSAGGGLRGRRGRSARS